MKKWILFFYIFLTYNLYAQNIIGTVTDKNNKPLAGANVYLDGSSIATATDSNGNFALTTNAKTNLALVVSFVGYQSQYFKKIDESKKMIIVLEAAVNQLNEVVIGNSKFSRKQMLELFRQQFLGITKVAKKNVIENEDAIYFSYNNQKKQLLAFSDEDLEILNPYYGYKIKYQLVRFEIDFAVLSIFSKDVVRSYYAGLSRFEEIDNSVKIVNRRKENYKSSSLCFFRNLANKEVTKNEFVIFDGSFATDYNRCFVVKDTLDLKKITVIRNPKITKNKKSVAEYNILYKKKAQSKIIFNTELFYIDLFGNFNETESIFFLGDFSEKRVANLLPLNFGL